jgi:hypothetical protein
MSMSTLEKRVRDLPDIRRKNLVLSELTGCWSTNDLWWQYYQATRSRLVLIPAWLFTLWVAVGMIAYSVLSLTALPAWAASMLLIPVLLYAIVASLAFPLLYSFGNGAPDSDGIVILNWPGYNLGRAIWKRLEKRMTAGYADWLERRILQYPQAQVEQAFTNLQEVLSVEDLDQVILTHILSGGSQSAQSRWKAQPKTGPAQITINGTVYATNRHQARQVAPLLTSQAACTYLSGLGVCAVSLVPWFLLGWTTLLRSRTVLNGNTFQVALTPDLLPWEVGREDAIEYLIDISQPEDAREHLKVLEVEALLRGLAEFWRHHPGQAYAPVGWIVPDNNGWKAVCWEDFSFRYR